MALPTAPTSPLTWTKISCTDGTGPDLYYTSATSSIGTTYFAAVGNGSRVVKIGAAPDVTAVSWTLLSPLASGAPGAALAYAGIVDAGHGVYLLPGGDLYYE